METAPTLALSRLVFLLREYPQFRVPRDLANYLPWGDWLVDLNTKGPGGSGVDLDQLKFLMEEGAKLGPGSLEELTSSITLLADESVLQETDPARRLRVYGTLAKMVSNPMIEEESFALASVNGAHESIAKFPSGFYPVDHALGGLYQGLLLLGGKPASGKTSLMLSLMEAVVKTLGFPVLFVENEIPGSMMKYRISQMRKRGTKFKPNDVMVCASWGTAQIIEYLDQHYQENLVVFFDSPDVTVSQNGNQDRRFSLEAAYQDLIRIKMKTKLVVASTQLRRKDPVPRMDSVAEAWSKAWYADMILGISSGGINKVKLTTLKNRFGSGTGNSVFKYNYEDLTWDPADVETEEEEW